MSLNLIYGKQNEDNFLDAGEAIAKDVAEGKFFEISKKLNNAFFEGGVFAPKSFASLSSVDIPKNPLYRESEGDPGIYFITIRKKHLIVLS